MKIFRTKRVIYRVENNENGTLNIFREYFSTKNMGFWEKDGRQYQNAGLLIMQEGGIDALLSKCEEIEDVAQFVHDLNVEKKAIRERANQERMRQMTAQSDKAKADYDKVFNGKDIVESTPENIYILLAYLNTVNWGVWHLPKMTIGYQCNQYDCDGKTATTIKLDSPVKYWDKPEKMFVYGNPRGCLEKYTKIG